MMMPLTEFLQDAAEASEDLKEEQKEIEKIKKRNMTRRSAKRH